MRAAAALLLVMALGQGCATLKPWEKEVLAQPYMKFRSENKTRPFLNHTAITVEQAEGGDGTAGGGCGCR